MAFRFWRRVRLAPGVTLNLSKSGGSLSFGPRGAKFTVGPRGSRATVGLPGTGLFYTQTASRSGSGRHASPHRAAAARSGGAQKPLTMGFFRRLVTPPEEEALVDGCRELTGGSEERALEHLRKAVHLADGAYLAGFLALKQRLPDEAIADLKIAADKHQQLGRCFSKYGLSAALSLAIAEGVTAHVGPDLRGVLLGLVEAYQKKKDWRNAISCLKKLRALEPDDAVVKLSLAELLMEATPGDRGVCREVVRLAEGIENDTPIHAALLLYKARALHGLGLLDAARKVLSAALRRRKDRSADLLRDLRYERALVYEESGQHSRARKDLEALYADAPDFRDVARRLGL